MQIVDQVSSTIRYDKEVTRPIQATHQDMVKFEDDDDAGFDSLCGTLKALRRHALQG